MGLIREPLDVDFEFDPRPLTEKEKEQISNYIKAYKENQSVKAKSVKQKLKTVKSRKKQIV